MTERPDPFVGLMPYGERDAEWFFGREREVEIISANLKASRLTLLYGESGVGKSSVLLAGVLPQLRALVAAGREQAVAVAERGVVLADPPPLAVTMFRDWRDRPLTHLAEAIRTAVEEASGNAIEPWDEHEPLADWLHLCTQEVRTVLVILDQFEEYFMYHPEEGGPATLAGELPDVLGDLHLRVNFLLGLREDALSKLDRFKGQIPDLFGNYLRLAYLERDAARVAIVAPVHHFNETVREDLPPVEIEDELVEAVLDGVRAGQLGLAGRPAASEPDRSEEAAAGRVETPYLQLVMQELWAAGTADGGLRLTRASLDELGGAAAIVSNHLSSAMAQLSQDDQAVAADLFSFLVTPSRTKIAHSPKDLAVWAERPQEQVTAVLRSLAASERRILRSVPPSTGEEQERYELYHDVLADAVQEWASRNQERRRLIGARRERFRRWRRRAAVVLGWVLFAVVAVLGVQWLTRDTGTDQAERSNDLAGKAREQLRANPELSLILALRAWDTAHTPAAESAIRDVLASSRARAVYPGGKGHPCAASCAGMAGSERTVPRPVSLAAPVYGGYTPVGAALIDDGRVSVSRDGRTIALLDGRKAVLWDPATGEPRAIAPGMRVASLAFIGSGSQMLLLTVGDRDVLLTDGGGGPAERLASDARLVAASADARYVAILRRGSHVVTVRRIGSERRVRVPVGPRVTSLAFSPSDASRLAVGAVPVGRDPVSPVRVVNWRSGKIVSTGFTEVEPGFIWSDVYAGFSPDGRRLAVTSDDVRTEVLNVDDGTHVFRAPRRFGEVYGFDPRGRRMITVERNLARLWNASTGRPLTTLGGHTYDIRSVGFSPDGSLVAAGAADGSTRIWKSGAGSPALELRAPGRRGGTSPVTHVEFTPSGRFLVTATDDGAVRVWDVTSGRPLTAPRRQFLVHKRFSEDGREVVAVTSDGALIRWNADDGRRTGAYPHLPGRVLFDSQLSMQGDIVVYARDRRKPRLETRPIAGGDVRPVKGEPGSFLLSDDGGHLLVMGTRMRVVDLSGIEPDVVVGGRANRRVFAGAISNGGTKVLLSGRQPALIDVSSGRARKIELHGTSLGGLAYVSGRFSPDGARLVTEGGRGAMLWDTADGRFLRRLEGHVGAVTSVNFSRDGQRVITGGQDRTVRLWETETGTPMGVIEGYPDQIRNVQLDPLGDRLLFETGYAGNAQVSSCVPCLGTRALVARAREHVTREPLGRERESFDLAP